MLALCTSPHGPLNDTPPANANSRNGPSVLCRGMAGRTTCECHEVLATRKRIRQIRRRHRLIDGLMNRQSSLQWLWNLCNRQHVVHRLDGSQINDYRSPILIRHLPEVCVGHHRKEATPIVTDTFANCSLELFIGPVAGAGLNVGRDIWRHEPGYSILCELCSSAFLAGLGLTAGLFPIDFRMALETVRGAFDDVTTAL